MCRTKSFGDSLYLLPLLSTSETACRVESSVLNWVSLMLSTFGFGVWHDPEKCPTIWHLLQRFPLAGQLFFLVAPNSLYPWPVREQYIHLAPVLGLSIGLVIISLLWSLLYAVTLLTPILARVSGLSWTWK